MDLISPLPCPPEDLPHLAEAREALVDELELRGRVALAALLPILALLWVTLRHAAQEDPRIHWLLGAVMAVGVLRIAIQGWSLSSAEKRHLRFTAGSTLLALLIAATTLLVFPRLTPIETGLLGMFTAGLGSASLVSMAPSPVTYLAYMVPVVGSLAVASHLHPVPDHPRIYQAVSWLFLVSMAALSLRVHLSLRNETFLRLRSRELALRDSLTGLHNRRFLTEFMEPESAQIQRAWSGPRNRPLTLKLMIIDLDHFKRVNDEHGHDAGDAVLKQLGALLRDIVRRPDVIVRWGGEEFVVVARDTGRVLPLGLAERVRRRVAEHVFQLPDGGTIRRTCSIGFALYPFLPDAPDQIGWEQCVGLADAGLYLAKEGGRDRWIGLEAGDTPWSEDSETYTTLRTRPTEAVSRGWVRLIRREP
jgi:diguanylate cyclase (GGDEF)-like protein